MTGEVLADLAREVYRARRAREDLLGAARDLLREPAWDILLDLYVARHDGKRVPVSSACVAGRTGQTTGLRCIEAMERAGLVTRVADAEDGRRRFVELTPAMVTALETWLASVCRQRSERARRGRDSS